jgi:hypothetical protein
MLVFEGYGQTTQQTTIAEQATRPSFWEQLKTSMSNIVGSMPLELRLGKYTIETGAGKVRVEKGEKITPVSVKPQVEPKKAGFDIFGVVPLVAIGGAVAFMLYMMMRKK